MKNKVCVGIAGVFACLSLCAVACKEEEKASPTILYEGGPLESSVVESLEVFIEERTESSSETSFEPSSDSLEERDSSSVDISEDGSVESSQEESSSENSSEESASEESSIECSHIFAQWEHDETQHWLVCACGERTNSQAHRYGVEECIDCHRSSKTFQLSEDGNYYILQSWRVTAGVVEIPATYEGKEVKEIASGAFYGQGMQEVCVSDNVTRIGAEAFANCTSLTRVRLGKGLTYIGAYAFDGCLALTKVEFATVKGWKTVFGESVPQEKLSTAEEAARYLKGEGTAETTNPLFGLQRK